MKQKKKKKKYYVDVCAEMRFKNAKKSKKKFDGV